MRLRGEQGGAWRPWLTRSAGLALAASFLLPLLAAGAPGSGPEFRRAIGMAADPGYVNDPMGIAASPAEDGRVYLVDQGNARIQVFSDDGEVIGAWGSRGNGPHQFFLPTDVAVSPDGRYVYVVDEGHRRVQRFAPHDDCFGPGARECFGPTQVLPFGRYGNDPDAGGLQVPTGVGTDAQGRVYVADSGWHKIVVFDGDGRPLPSFGEPGNGPGELLRPRDVAVDGDGVIWVADTDNHRLSFFSPDWQYQGQWTGGKERLYHPSGLAVDAAGSFVVRDYEPSYQVPQAALYEAKNKKNLWSVSLGSEAAASDFPLQGATVLADGTVLLTDPQAPQNSLVQVLPGGVTRLWGATRGYGAMNFDHPLATAIDPHLLGIVDGDNRRAIILERGSEGEHVKAVLGAPFNADFALSEPHGIAIHRTGPQPYDAVIYITDAAQHTVYVASPAGERLARWGDGVARTDADGLKAPHGIAVAPNGEVFIADTGNNRIVRRAPYPGNEVLNAIGRAGDDPGELTFPMAVAYGPGDRVYVLEVTNNRLQAFAPDGAFIYEWPSGEGRCTEPGDLWMPVGLAADEHFLYVLESDAPYDHVRVQVMAPQPGVPLADSLIAIFPEGGRGPGTAQLWDPRGIAAGDGWVAVADSGNNRVMLYQWPDEPVVPPTNTPGPTLTPTDPPPTVTPTVTEASPPTPTDPSPSPTDAPATATPTVLPTTAAPPATTPPPVTEVPTATATRPIATGSPTPPSSNTRPTPPGGIWHTYMPLTVKWAQIGSKWR